MATILYKWLLVFVVCTSMGFMHPIFVSVTEIEYKKEEKNIELSCKIFTNDFENALKQHYKTNLDLLNPTNKEAIEIIVSDYIRKTLRVEVDDKKISLTFLGYEKIEEGIYCYLQASNVQNFKKIQVTDKVLYDYKKEQVSVLHVTVNGERKSTKITNPVEKADFEF